MIPSFHQYLPTRLRTFSLPATPGEGYASGTPAFFQGQDLNLALQKVEMEKAVEREKTMKLNEKKLRMLNRLIQELQEENVKIGRGENAAPDKELGLVTVGGASKSSNVPTADGVAAVLSSAEEEEEYLVHLLLTAMSTLLSILPASSAATLPLSPAHASVLHQLRLSGLMPASLDSQVADASLPAGASRVELKERVVEVLVSAWGKVPKFTGLPTHLLNLLTLLQAIESRLELTRHAGVILAGVWESPITHRAVQNVTALLQNIAYILLESLHRILTTPTSATPVPVVNNQYNTAPMATAPAGTGNTISTIQFPTAPPSHVQPDVKQQLEPSFASVALAWGLAASNFTNDIGRAAAAASAASHQQQQHKRAGSEEPLPLYGP